MNIIKKIALLAIGLILTSCYFPEKFDSDIVIKKDFTYKVKFDGDVIFLPARIDEVSKNKPLSTKDEKDLADLVKDLKKDSNIKSVEYLGHGKYHIILEAKGILQDNKQISFPGKTGDSALYYLARKGNIVRFSFKNISKKDNKQLAELNLNKVEWKVALEPEGKVNDSNAQSKPILGLGSYKWSIKNTSESLPYAVIQID